MELIKEFFTDHRLLVALIYIVFCWILLQIIDLIYKRAQKVRPKTIQSTFTKGILQAFIVILTFLRVVSLSTELESLTSTLLMSSSLLVVVLGFIFQEGLSNIVHGMILAVFKPFNIGDRVEITTSSGVITGYVKELTLRHTTIRGLTDQADTIVSNALIDNSTIRNLTAGKDNIRYPLTVSLPYPDAMDTAMLEKAKAILSEETLNNPRTVDPRTSPEEPVFINVKLAESSVDLTIFVYTRTAEDNYYALSEIQEALLGHFAREGLTFAYPHVEVSGEIRKTK